MLCGLLLGLMTPAAWGQTATSPPAGTLQLPPAHKPAAAAAPKAPQAAPITPVQQVGKSPPVLQPHGPTHAQKPPAGAAQKTTPTKPTTSAPVVTPPPTEAAKPPEMPDKGANSGLPLPRFAALRSDEVNLRAGPGTRYPIDWVYKRRDLPVEIEREFEVWRLVKDPDGVKGWVHQATLTGRRSFIVAGGEATLRRNPADTASAVAVLKPGVIGHIRSCDAGAEWCQVQAGDYRGYLKRSQFWGSLPGEAITN
jgi:SH3-like domain-containing protein